MVNKKRSIIFLVCLYVFTITLSILLVDNQFLATYSIYPISFLKILNVAIAVIIALELYSKKPSSKSLILLLILDVVLLLSIYFGVAYFVLRNNVITGVVTTVLLYGLDLVKYVFVVLFIFLVIFINESN